MCWCFFNALQAPDNTAASLTSCLWRPSRQTQSERFGPSQVFPGQHGHGFLYSEEYVGAFQSPMNMLSLGFSFCYFGQLLVCPQSYCCLRRLLCEVIATDFFQQMPQGKDCLRGVSSESGQIKTRPWVEVSRELPDMSNSSNYLGMGLWAASNPTYPVQWLLVCCFSQLPWLWGCLFSMPLQNWWRRVGIGKVKLPQKILPRFSHFSWLKTPWDVARIWLNSTILKKFIWTVLPVFSLLLWKNRFFGSLLHHSGNAV